MKAKLRAHQEILDRLESKGICMDLAKRWEEGMDHHPQSVALVESMAALDFELGSDSLCIKTGGDGDNGEHMMYLLDLVFEDLEKIQ